MPVKSDLLWCDKYRPRSFNDLIFHENIGQRLENLSLHSDFPHLLFHGISGAGKKTLIYCVLRSLYGPSVDNLKIEELEFVSPTNKKKVEITGVGSAHHIMVTPSFLKPTNKLVVQEVINQLADNRNINDTGKKINFKVIVLDECDKLTRDAQNALRRTMEICTKQCRLILCCNSTSRIIPALHSRVFPIRVPAPSKEDMRRVLEYVLKKENLSLECDHLLNQIVMSAAGNMRRAILMLEMAHAEKYPWAEDQMAPEYDWLKYIRETASMLVQEQSSMRLVELRERFYKLLEAQIPYNIIFRELCLALIKVCDDTHIRKDVVRIATECEHLCCQGQKPILHLESFAAQFMYSYKQFIEQMM
ncbi:hypothetical protein ACOME3_006522 [Neoechinorhynchus agilis]